MLSKRAKYLYGIQVSLSSMVGSIPFYWNFKQQKLCLIKQNSLKYKKWVIIMCFIWLH